MGNTGRLHHAGALAALVLLTGCNEGQKVKMWTRDEIADIASDYQSDTSELESRISDLESAVESRDAKISSLEAEIAAVRSEISDLDARAVKQY